jgi:hypothetical protein
MKGSIVTALLATTHKLPNGHQFTRSDLEVLSKQINEEKERKLYIYREHRTDAKPFGRTLDVWVGKMEDSDIDYALYMRFEVLDDVPVDEAKELVKMGFSLAFFKGGYSSWQDDGSAPELLVGLTPNLKPDLEGLLKMLTEDIENTKIAVREYHEHSAIVEGTLIVVVSLWLLERVAGKLVEHLVDRFIFGKAFAFVENKPESLKLQIDTRNGRVNAYVPMTDNVDKMREAVSSIVSTALKHNSKSSKETTTIGITYDRTYIATVTESKGNNLDLRG